MSKKVPGSCLCGAIRFEVSLPSRFCAHCHCDNCRRAHGAAFVTWFGVPEEQLSFIEGRQTLQNYRTETDATRGFCGSCGSTLFYSSPRWVGEIHIALANMEGEIDRAPGGHVYVDHRADWWSIHDDLVQFGGTTGMEKKS